MCHNQTSFPLFDPQCRAPGLGIEMRLLDRDKQTPRHKDSLVWLVAETSSRNNRHVTLSENKLNRIMHRHGAAVQHANSSG